MNPPEKSTHSNPIIRAIANHWVVTHKLKTERQEEIERNLCLYIPGIPFTRWILFLAAFVIQFCCGSLYAWSVYNAPIDMYIHGTTHVESAVYTFYIAVGVFGTTTAIMGSWLERHGPRVSLMTGATSIGIGHAIAAISCHYRRVAGIYVGYGILAGFGLGLSYISPVSALQKYFPDYRGIAAGFAVGGFGAGSVVWGKVILPLVNVTDVASTLGILGSIICATILIAAIAIRTPPNNFSVGGLNIEGESINKEAPPPPPPANKPKEGDEETAVSVYANLTRTGPPKLTFTESFKSPDFIFMYLMFFSNEIFGLVALSRLSDMVVKIFGKSLDDGATVVSVNGVFNCCGRLFLPMVSDTVIRLTSRGGAVNVNPSFVRKCIFCCTLSIQTAILASLSTIIRIRNFDAFRAVMWILTLCYGAGFGTIPCFLTDMFGPYNIGALHGVILTAWSIAGVAGGLGFTAHLTELQEAGYTYAEGIIANLWWCLGICAAGFLTITFVRTNRADRCLPGWRLSIFGVKLWHIGANNL